MYGTIARFRVLPGKGKEMLKLMSSDDALAIDGWVADYIYQTDNDPDEFFLVAFFRNKSTYLANANSAGQHNRYMKWRALLTDDPEWNDGMVVVASGPQAHK